MRKLIMIMIMSLFGYIAGVQAHGEERAGSGQKVQSMVADPMSTTTVDCTIHVNFTTDDGTRIEGDLTFVDIPWWECAAIKIGNFLSKIF